MFAAARERLFHWVGGRGLPGFQGPGSGVDPCFFFFGGGQCAFPVYVRTSGAVEFFCRHLHMLHFAAFWCRFLWGEGEKTLLPYILMILLRAAAAIPLIPGIDIYVAQELLLGQERSKNKTKTSKGMVKGVSLPS